MQRIICEMYGENVIAIIYVCKLI